MTAFIGRREFITLLGGAAAAWPLAARAQQPEQMRRIGVLLSQAESDPVAQSYITTFAARLRELGWIDGKNLLIDYRWGGGNTTRMPPLARELVVLQPHALLAATAASAVQLRQYTLTIPIIFTQVGDPVALGLVTNLARPNGNITGFTSFDYAIGGKWLQALKECAPGLARVAVFFEPGNPSSIQYVTAIEAAASSVGVGLVPSPVQSEMRSGKPSPASLRQRSVRSSRSPPLASCGIVGRSSPLRRNIACSQCTPTAFLRWRAGSCLTVPIWPTNFGKRRSISTAS